MTIGQHQSFRLQVLGAPSLTDGAGVTPSALGWGKPLALLCLLAVRGEVRRDEVVDLLWRDIDEAKARNAFRQALHRLRSALGDDLIPQDRERLRLVKSARISIDLDEFESAAAAGRFDEALRLYGGDFLENTSLNEPSFDHWAEHERTRLIAVFKHVLQEGVTDASGSGNLVEAVARSRRLLAAAPFEASSAQLAAATLVTAGRRTEAQELLRQFGARLQAELGLPMPPELQSLLTRIERHRDQAQGANSRTARASSEFLLPFVGRAAELSQLLTLWRTTGEDSGALALIEAEAGFGKTRLVRELASHAKSLGPATVLLGRERAAGAQVPFGVFAEALRPLVRAKGVLGASRHLLAEAARLLPELRDEIDLPPVNDVADDASRLRFFEGVAALIDAAAFEQPILLVLEDLQFIAPSSLELLAYLTVRLAGSAVAFVLTLRPSESSPALVGRLRALAQPSTIGTPPHGPRAQAYSLSALSSAASHEAVANLARQLGVAQALADRIVQRAQGNPARLSEMLRRAAAGDDVAALPVSMRDLLSERLQRLTSAQRRTFLVVALIGRPVVLKVISSASHLSESAAHESIEALAQEGLVERHGMDIVAAPLPAQIALEAAGQPGRAFLAGWVAEALAREPRVSQSELAGFFAAAGQSTAAFEHAHRAAYDALAMGAAAEAAQFLSLARTFATTPKQQSEVESFLAALGSGRPLLPAPATVEDNRVAEPAIAAPVVSDDAIAPRLGWERLFPNWRILLGAAIATLVISAAVLATRPVSLQPSTRAPVDTLIVTDGESGNTVRFVAGDITTGFSVSERANARASEPAWLDSLARPWVDRIASPNGRSVAIAKVTASGTDVYVLSADRRDTLVLIAGRGDGRPLAWSPDGRWLLATTTRTLADGSFDADLFAYRIGASRSIVALDTLPRRAVTEAAWSPDGSRIAWAARVGAERQMEVFASWADGSGVQDISRHPADDYHIAWSENGDLLAFTSMRDGNAEIYAQSFRENRLWRLTRDPAQDDRGAFSRSGRLIAFESTRGGSAGVYVMPSLGGEPSRVGAGLPLSLRAWTGTGRRYVDRVRADAGLQLRPGDTTTVRLAALDQFGEPIAADGVRWSLLDSMLASTLPHEDSTSDELRLVARRAGLARVAGNVGRWRFDTAFVHIGDRAIVLLDGGEDLFHSWRPLGIPLPSLTGAGANSSIVLHADREWESGVLSRTAVPLSPGLTFSVTVAAPFAGAADVATSVSVALVAPEEAGAIDVAAPQFLRYAAFSWNAEAGRFVYSVGSEVFTEAATSAGTGSAVPITLRIEGDSTVSFSVGGRQRWRSTLHIIDARHESRVLAWVGGRATGDRVRLSGARVLLNAPE